MRRGFGKNGNGERTDSDRMEGNRTPVQYSQGFDSERIDDAMRYQNTGEDTYGVSWRGIEIMQGSKSSDKSGASETDTGRSGHKMEIKNLQNVLKIFTLTQLLDPAC